MAKLQLVQQTTFEKHGSTKTYFSATNSCTLTAWYDLMYSLKYEIRK